MKLLLDENQPGDWYRQRSGVRRNSACLTAWKLAKSVRYLRLYCRKITA